MALAWKAGWVQALAGSNPASSAPRGLRAQIVGAECSVSWPEPSAGSCFLQSWLACCSAGPSTHDVLAVGAGWPCPRWCCERALARTARSNHHVPKQHRRGSNRSAQSLAFWAGTRYLGAGRFGYGSSVAAVRDHEPDLALTVTSFGDPQLAVATPRRAWVALYHWSLMVVLAMACAILHRAIERRGRMSSWLRLSRRVRSGGRG
jgi:hypothetical protein